MPAVSVVIPTYNSATLLPRALASALRQTHADLEVLVIDDASTDETGTLVNKQPDSRIRYLRHESNRGGSAARNTGIRAAQGDFVAFLDADDEWMPDKLTTFLTVIDAAQPDADGAVSSYYRVDSDGTRHLIRVTDDSLRPPSILERSVSGAGSSLVVQRDRLVEIGLFDEALPRHQDWDLMFRLAKVSRIVAIDQPLHVTFTTGYPDVQTVRQAKRVLMPKLAPDIAAQPFRIRQRIRASHDLDLMGVARATNAPLSVIRHGLAAVARYPHPRVVASVVTTIRGAVLGADAP